MAPGEGIFFDEYIELERPGWTELTQRVLKIYDATRPMKRKRGRANLRLRIQALMANALRVHFFGARASVLYFRERAARHYLNSPQWMKNGALGEVVDVLEKAGLVRTVTGKKMPGYSKKQSWASSYAATDKLLGIAVASTIEKSSIKRHIPNENLVQLVKPKTTRSTKAYEPQPNGSRRDRRISYEPTVETEQWVTDLMIINQFYRKQEIKLSLSDAELAEWLTTYCSDAKHEKDYLRLPETFMTDMYRVFNNGNPLSPTFEQGGRLAGGWWMSIPSGLRAYLIINNDPTIEFDYAECFPRMLYHERDISPTDDLYTIPEVTDYALASGLEPNTFRAYIKWMTQVLINCRGRPEAVEVPADIRIPLGFTKKQIIRLIADRHQPIADAFNSGAGLRLMRIESDIALTIVKTATAEGWTALPVHDSFVAPVNKMDRLVSLMTSAYSQRLNGKPLIRRS